METDTYVEKSVTMYKHSLVALYKNDLIIACSNQQLCNNLKESFAKKFKMKILGEFSHILGMDVKVDIS